MPVHDTSMALGVVDALDAAKGVHSHGLTFLGALAPGRDLFVSYGRLRADVISRSASLKALGLKKGDRLALVLPEGQDFIPIFLAALWAGIVPVPLYPPATLGKLDAFMEALSSILKIAEPKVLVTSEKIKPLLWSMIGKVPSLGLLISPGKLPQSTAIGPDRPEPVSGSDLALLQFTSGSTSTPKGVQVTHGNLAANCHAIREHGLHLDRERDHAVSWLPLYHDMGLIGLVLVPLTAGVSVTYIPTTSFIRNATLWLETIHRTRATVSFAPNFAYALVTRRARREQIARWDLSSMRVFGCGAEPIQPQTLRDFVDTFSPCGLRPEALLPCYGMAEATLAISFVGLEERLRADRIDASRYCREQRAVPVQNGAASLEVVSCGRPFPEHEIAILDERGVHLPERKIGEICLRGPSVAAGYFGNPEASRAAGMVEGGWLRTGDQGYLAAGELYVSGRLKDLLIINGRNFYPQRIEWAVERIAGVRKGSPVVFSRPGPASEEVVVVVETRHPEPARLQAEIVATVNDDLQLAVADVVLVAPGSLPKTSSGKLQRRKARELYLAGELGAQGRRRRTAANNKVRVAKLLAYSLVGRARHQARGWFRRFLPPQV